MEPAKSESSRKVPIRLIRLKNFLKIILRNRMATAGLIVLTLTVLGAAAAPLITPYDPQAHVVAGRISPPQWVTLFTGDAGRSGNAEFADIALNGEGAGVTLTQGAKGADSIEFTVGLDGSQPAGTRIQLLKSLNWQFKGAPARFNGNLVVIADGVSNNAVVDANAFFERPSDNAHWQLWGQRMNVSAHEYFPRSRFDSNDEVLKVYLGFGSTFFTPAEIIFAKPALYLYGLELVLPSGPLQLRVTVQDLDMFLFGNTWGVLGTDNQGRDIFSQMLYGARLSLTVGLLAAGIGISLGLVVGLVAGYLKGIVDETLMRFTDMLLVIPGLPLLIVLVAVLTPSLWTIIMVLGLLGWMGFARLVRSQVLSVRERPFIEAARASGAGTSYTLARHIFPNIVGLTYVNLALSVPGAIVGEAALSFLGLFDPSVITWGRMLNEAQVSGGSATQVLWWWVIPPGLGIALLSLSFILLGYALDDIFNPKLRQRR